MLARARSHVDQIVGGFDQVEVVLHHQHGVAQIAQAAQDVDQPLRVAGMQTNRRLVEDVKHARQTRPEQGSQPQALGFARRESRRGTFQTQVADSHFQQSPDALVQVIQNRTGDAHFLGGEMRRQGLDPRVEVVERQLRNRDDGLARHGHGAAFGAQARAFAVETGLGGEEVLQFFEIGGVGGVLVVAALEVGDHALEASLRVGGGRLDIGEVAAELRAVGAVQKQVALDGRVILDGFGRVELEAKILARVLHDLAVVVAVELDPAIDGEFGDALALVHEAADDGLAHHAQTRAGGAGSRGFVEREVCHAHLGHRRAAMRAGIGSIGAFVGFVLPVLVSGFIGGRRDILPTLGAGAMSETGVQNSQIGEDFGDGSNRRAGTVIRQVLVHADGG